MTYKPRRTPGAKNTGGLSPMTTVHIERALGRLEGKMDAVLKGQEQLHEGLALVTARTTKLERWQSWVIGVSATVGAGAALAMRLLGV